MPQKKKEMTFEKMKALIEILNHVKSQPTKDPLSKIQVAATMGLKTSEVTDEYKLIEAKEWVTRRTGPEPRSIYLKITAKGNAAMKAWSLLFK